jgi:hypothetical protein
MSTVITQYQGKKLGEKELNRILTEIEALSEEDSRRLLAEQSGTENTRD